MMCGSIHSPLVKAIQEQESVSVWRMPPSLSQSRLGGRCSPSNACTVIAVRMAEIIHRTDTWMPTALYGNKICPPRVIACLTNAILDGNILHEEALERRLSDEQNFTIPDAIRACKNAFMEVDFCTVPGPLSIELPFYLQAVIKSKELSRDPRLFFLLIAFERTVLIVYERATSSMTLFDSHMHGHSDGAVIATGHVDNLTDLCEWLSYNIFHESQELEEDYNREFEISLIRFCGSTSSGDCCLPQATSPCEFPVFDATRWRRKRRLDTKTAIRILKHARADRRPKTDVLSKGSRQQTCVPLASLSSLRSRGF